MPIYQTNLWICEICGKIESTVEEVSPYDDPVVISKDKKDWNYTGDFPNEKLTCAECLEKIE